MTRDDYNGLKSVAVASVEPLALLLLPQSRTADMRGLSFLSTAATSTGHACECQQIYCLTGEKIIIQKSPPLTSVRNVTPRLPSHQIPPPLHDINITNPIFIFNLQLGNLIIQT
jgi:hypothetical protein